MIDLTPLEVRKKKGDFRRAMRGYDPALVDDFLDLVADRLDQLVRENMALHERVTKQDAQVTDYRDRERALTEALVSAQEMREEVRRQSTRDADLAKQAAEQYAAQLRAEVEEEVRQLRSSAQQETSQGLASIRQERQREEEALNHLRARQQEFLNAYRSFLEEELAELAAMARAAEPPTHTEEPRQPPAEAAYVLDAPPGEDVEETFAPEPFEPELYVDESSLVTEALDEEAVIPVDGVSSGEPDATEVSGAELRLYDTIAADEPGAGVPGAVGLGTPEAHEWSSAPDWSLPGVELAGSGSGTDEIDLDGDDDPETAILLRNAAAAGYRLTEDDEPDELLLDDAVVEEAEPNGTDDDGWLPTLLEDDK